MTIQVGSTLTTDDVVAAAGGAHVSLAPGLAEQMEPARRLIEEVVASERTVYGVTTGFGYLANVRISAPETRALQRDIVLSHATAVGEELPEEVVRAMLLLKARTFGFGISGVRFELVERLVDMLRHGMHPVVPSQGSLGASGDLAPLAHLALPLIGRGEVRLRGERLPTEDALRRLGWAPLELTYKEGLSLVNGTEGMLALGILTLHRVERLARAADITGAMTVEACLGTDQAFAEALVGLRKHAGPLVTAANLRKLLAGSEIVQSHRESEHLVQDAYSLRCIPQVHGAYRDALAYVRTTLEAELASAIDNPSVLADEGVVGSAGNFHGEALALALDHLGLLTAGFATISERRVARLVDPELNNGLPAFLTKDPGRRSGFMLVQYTAAALVSENRSLCFSASSDSIPTSAGQEDHVSMGMTSARKSVQIATNTERALAVEALAAAQGIGLRHPLKAAPGTGAGFETVRALSPELEEDRPLSGDIEAMAQMIAGRVFEGAVEAAVGPLA
ncbi:MAG: histidine ammonia-lyase [Actinomycetota bacterium]|nr:histidine ammonia-lyase [Actinomycetota bacterium]